MQTNTGTLAAVADVVRLNVSKFNSAVLFVKGGTVNAVGLNVTFEGSVDSSNGIDGTWFTLSGTRTNANTIESSSGVIAPNVGATLGYAWRINVSNVRYVRIRVTAITSGNAVGIISASEAMSETAPGIQTHAVTQSGVFTTTPTTTTPYNLVTTASTNAAIVKSTAGTLYEITVSNVTATPAFVKIYNKATAPTVGTDTPVLTIPVAASTTVPIQFGALGKRLSAGIGIAVTAAALATDVAVTVAGIQINANYV